jgi:glycosyltransferase involved in cell wall biosynthesis
MQNISPQSQAGQAFDWQIGVFCHNERERIGLCINAIDTAVDYAGKSALITVIVNGSTDGSLSAAQAAGAAARATVRYHPSEIADKSSAINRFFYEYRVPADLYFCVDGNVIIDAKSLVALENSMTASPRANAATGYARNGRTEPKLNGARSGQLRGPLLCFRASFLDRMVAAGISLPVGHYRGDGLLAHMATYDLDPVNNERNPDLALNVADAWFEIYSLSITRPSHLLRQFRRKLRQMRGLVENAAVRSIVHNQGYAALPKSSDHMLRDYLLTHPAPSVGLPDRPFMALALQNLRKGGLEGVA